MKSENEIKEETGGLVACPQKRFWKAHPLERRKAHFCKAGYKLLSSLIFVWNSEVAKEGDCCPLALDPLASTFPFYCFVMFIS